MRIPRLIANSLKTDSDAGPAWCTPSRRAEHTDMGAGVGGRSPTPEPASPSSWIGYEVEGGRARSFGPARSALVRRHRPCGAVHHHHGVFGRTVIGQRAVSRRSLRNRATLTIFDWLPPMTW